MSKMKTAACVYGVIGIPPFLLFSVEEGVKLGWSGKKMNAANVFSSFGTALFKGVFYPYFFYKYAKGEISFE
ncbi:transmembrane domain-containing protein [Marseillevirus Shanghai 1]|nr:transmembrane domain-containing protein [Marseillevirus Shanghai 1]